MATYTFSQFHLEEASRLIDLESAKSDLQDVVFTVDYILRAFETDERLAYQILEAFSTLAVIKYWRAFNSGVRQIGSGDLQKDLPDAIASSHQYFLDWRNKHLAHSVNGFEMGAIQARYCSDRVLEEGITSITVAQTRIVALGSRELNELRSTASYFIERFEEPITQEKEAVLNIVRAMPIEDVLARDEGAMVPDTDRAKAGRSRKRKGF